MKSFLKAVSLKVAQNWWQNKTMPRRNADIKLVTAHSINAWAIDTLNTDTDNLPFPFIQKVDFSTGTDWQIIDWNYSKPLWQIQDEFYLLQVSTGKEWRWINGRTTPMEKQRANPRD